MRQVPIHAKSGALPGTDRVEQGIQPTQGKVRAIRDTPAPTDLHQLKLFLGLLNFYAKFVPNLSTVLTPLYSLSEKN